jgi:hypothetical protein
MESRVELFALIRRDTRVEGLSVRTLNNEMPGIGVRFLGWT